MYTWVMNAAYRKRQRDVQDALGRPSVSPGSYAGYREVEASQNACGRRASPKKSSALVNCKSCSQQAIFKRFDEDIGRYVNVRSDVVGKFVESYVLIQPTKTIYM